ncbi:uncharacterized protein LOC142341438 isoform X2 [Convolutriloba macropyga]|uniref:uncharacterized protein LOC142341438 isoform X2 n=1 Tax=Convolutriloba macropyga TaxID=536237 RepID=UPI003F51F380
MSGEELQRKTAGNRIVDCSGKESGSGFEIVPLMRRPIFMSPPLVFCFKGCPVGIPCGRCKKMVRSSIRSIISLVQEDLITQLSNHYLLNFWISDTVHTSFFEQHPELNRQASCIVCHRRFTSIASVLKHVREIVLDVTLRSRCWHWLILENVTNLFVNRDIGFVATDKELVNLLAKLFPQFPEVDVSDRPSFAQIFQSLRSVIESASVLPLNEEVMSLTGTQLTQLPLLDDSILDGSADGDEETTTSRSAPFVTSSGRDSGPSSTEGDLIVVEPETESNVIVSISIEQSSSLPSASDHDSHSSFADVEDLSEQSVNTSAYPSSTAEVVAEVIESDENEQSEFEEVEITWVTHHERVSRWISMRPVGSHELRCHGNDDAPSADALSEIQSSDEVQSSARTMFDGSFSSGCDSQLSDVSFKSENTTNNTTKGQVITRVYCKNNNRKLSVENDVDVDNSDRSPSTFFEELQMDQMSERSFAENGTRDASRIDSGTESELQQLSNRTFSVQSKQSLESVGEIETPCALVRSSALGDCDKINASRRKPDIRQIRGKSIRKSHFDTSTLREETSINPD